MYTVCSKLTFDQLAGLYRDLNTYSFPRHCLVLRKSFSCDFSIKKDQRLAIAQATMDQAWIKFSVGC
jgi:hypothetical protein